MFTLWNYLVLTVVHQIPFNKRNQQLALHSSTTFKCIKVGALYTTRPRPVTNHRANESLRTHTHKLRSKQHNAALRYKRKQFNKNFLRYKA